MESSNDGNVMVVIETNLPTKKDLVSDCDPSISVIRITCLLGVARGGDTK